MYPRLVVKIPIWLYNDIWNINKSWALSIYLYCSLSNLLTQNTHFTASARQTTDNYFCMGYINYKIKNIGLTYTYRESRILVFKTKGFDQHRRHVYRIHVWLQNLAMWPIRNTEPDSVDLVVPEFVEVPVEVPEVHPVSHGGPLNRGSPGPPRNLVDWCPEAGRKVPSSCCLHHRCLPGSVWEWGCLGCQLALVVYCVAFPGTCKMKVLPMFIYFIKS